MLHNVNAILKINCVFLLFLTYPVRIILSSVENLKNYYKKNYYYTKKKFQTRKNLLLLLKHIIMVKLITHELRVIAGKRGIKNYQNMSREKLLSTINESDCIFENFSQNGLERIAKMQIFHKMSLSESQKCRIFHKINFSKS